MCGCWRCGYGDGRNRPDCAVSAEIAAYGPCEQSTVLAATSRGHLGPGILANQHRSTAAIVRHTPGSQHQTAHTVRSRGTPAPLSFERPVSRLCESSAFLVALTHSPALPLSLPYGSMAAYALSDKHSCRRWICCT